LRVGGSTEVDVPLTDPAVLKQVASSYGKPSTKARMLITLPAGFQPNAPQRLLIASSTTDGEASSINAARRFLPEGPDKGFVVIGVDGEFRKPKDDGTDFRWAIVSGALTAIQKEWPQSKTWPIVTAGTSGGGGYASHQGIMLVDKGFPVIGMFLAVSGWNPTNFPEALRRAPRGTLHNVPIFMSAGDSDKTATPEITAKAHSDVKAEGFKKIRFEKFPGGHQLNKPHLQAALDWFIAESKTSGGAKH
jgi:hypothetical protein